MTIPYLTHQQLLQLIISNGYSVQTINEGWLQIEKEENRIPFKIKEIYYFPVVVRLCMGLNIEPPEEHLRCFHQVKIGNLN